MSASVVLTLKARIEEKSLGIWCHTCGLPSCYRFVIAIATGEHVVNRHTIAGCVAHDQYPGDVTAQD